MFLLSITSPRLSVIRWLQIIFTLIALGFGFQYAPQWWLLTISVYFLTGCLGITVTYHRFLSHRSFHLPRWAECLFSWFGAMGGTGSTIAWVAIHKLHHQYSDTDQDPHSPQGAGWPVLFGAYQFDFNKWQVRKLVTDPFHVRLHNYYHLWLVLWALLLLVIDVRLFLFGFIAPVAVQLWMSNLSNYFSHTSGYRNFETRESSRNNPWLAVLTWGEGWHNNHHQYPARWNFAVRWWEFDMSAWVIRIFGWNAPQTHDS